MKFLFVAIILFFASTSYGQSEMNEEIEVRGLMDKFEKLGRAQNDINGWRIKIINTTDRRKMERAKYKFQELYPEKESISSYENPYYSIRTGAYQTRLELEPFLVKLKEDFDSVIPVRDKISKQEIVAALING